MIIIRPGNKKFVRVCKEKIFEVTCKCCNAVMEVQHGELLRRRQGIIEPVTFRFACPYCGKYHSDYDVRYVREDTMNVNDVVCYDSVRNPAWDTTEEDLNNMRFKELKERHTDNEGGCTYLSINNT